MSAKPSYTVTTAAPADAEAELLRMWARNLPVGDDVQRKFDWIYRDAPRRPDTVFLLSANGDVVGTAGIGLRRFRVGGASVDAALFVDLAVDRRHRSLLPALQLVRAVREQVLSTQAFVYGFPNKNAIGVFKRARYKRLGAFARYARVLRHKRYLGRIAELPRVPAAFGRVLHLPIAPRLLGRAIDAARVAMDAPKIAGALARFRLQVSDRADDRIDEVWRRAGHEYRVVAERSAEFAAWRFARRAHTYFYLRDRDRAGAARAYAVASVESGEFTLWDMFGTPDHIGALLDAVIPRAVASGARTMTLRFLGDPRVVAVLISRGFREVEAERSVLYDVGAALAADRAVVVDPSAWYLMDVDEDE